MSVHMYNPPTATPTPNPQPQDHNPIFLSIRHSQSFTTRKSSHQIYTSKHWSSLPVWAKRSFWSETLLILLWKTFSRARIAHRLYFSAIVIGTPQSFASILSATVLAADCVLVALLRLSVISRLILRSPPRKPINCFARSHNFSVN